MIPSVFALIVLAVGLILLHFGIEGFTSSLKSLSIVNVQPVAAALGPNAPTGVA